MAKAPTLADLTNLANVISALATINANSTALEAAFDNTLSRDGSTPNNMLAELDMDSHRILNVADPVSDLDAVNLRSVGPLVQDFASQIVQTAVFGTQVVDNFTGSIVNGQTSLLLSQSPGTLANLAIFVNGSALLPGVDFAVSGSDNRSVTLSTPLVGTDEVFARYSKALPTGVADADAVLYDPPSTGSVSTVQGFLDLLWTSTGASFIRYIQTGAGAVIRTILDKLRENVTPQDFGAVMDGVTDDTAAMSAFFTRLQSTGATGTLLPGVYNVSSGFNITQPITLRGTKQSEIHNVNASLSTPVIRLSGAATTKSVLDTFGITSVPVANANAHGIQVDGGNNFILRGLRVADVQVGINIPNSQSGATVADCFVHNTISHGYVVDGGNLVMSGCYAINCGGHGFSFTTLTAISGGITLSHCTNFHSGLHGFAFQGNTTYNMGDVFLTGCVNSETPNGDGYMFDTYGKNIMVTGCFSEIAGGSVQGRGFRFTVNNHRVTLADSQATFSGGSGVSMECSWFAITGGDYTANNTSNSAQGAGVLVAATGAVSDFSIVGINTKPKPVADINQQIYGINFFSTGNSNGVVSACVLSGTAAALNLSSSPTVLVTNCPGYKNEAWGTATITTGNAVVNVSHGLSGTPSIALATPSDVNISPNIFWTGSKGASTFNINMSGTRGSDTSFQWYARL